MTRRLAAGALLLLAGAAHAQTFAWDGAALRDVIADVERRSDWRFLYPDALVAGKHVRARADADGLPGALARALAPQGVGVEADRQRRRILLVPAPTSTRPPVASGPPAERPSRTVRGRVLDGGTGEPLPFATVTWGGGQRGVVTDAAGGFVLTLRDAAATGRTPLTASFVGYRAQTAAPGGASVVFRLQPEAVAHAAVVVDAVALAAPVDTAWAARLQPGRYDAVGEGGGLRALEVLPAVAPSALFSEGLVVRGSPSDAFEVRLDGVPIYNPRHLFGLVDAFNGDALRAVALHVGVAPAQVALAPGGAVEYVTATGSPRRPAVQVGVSSLAARVSAAAPLRPGRTTLLVGGRRSLLEVAPGGGGGLVEQGLGVVRRTSPLPTSTTEVLSRVLDVQATSAVFWDLHAGLADERPGGGRTVVTAYAGGDETELDARRFLRQPTDGDPNRLTRGPVSTRNRWGSRAVSLVDQHLLTPRLVLASTVGGSLYDARFARDDFTFRLFSDAVNPLAQRVDTLGYDNDLREGVVAQRLDAVLGGGVASGGYSLHAYRQRYQETALARTAFVAEQTATRLDLHAAWEGRLAPALDVDAGLRAHVYSAGPSLRVSPRLRARLGVVPGVAVSGAVGRSVQFVHRLTLGNAAGAAVWVLSDTEDTVTEADLAEATAEVGGRAGALLLTAYSKRTRGQWLHAEDRALGRFSGPSVLALPWLTGVDGWARGVEVLARAPVGPWSLGVSAAVGRSDLQHPALNDGAAFPAAWDRAGRATLLADGPLLPGVRLAAAWTVASGAPNPLVGEPDEAARLSPISRLDLRLVAHRRLGAATASLAVAVRNVFDDDNAITREPTALVRRNAEGRIRPGVVPLDVYDAGVLPTVDLALRW